MKYFIQKISDVYGCTPLNYLLYRMPIMQFATIQTHHDLDEICHHHIDKYIPIVPKEQLPSLPQKESTVQLLMETARKSICDIHRTVPGEAVISELFTYLSEPYDEYEAGTAVLRLETNYAVLFFFFRGYRVNEQGVYKIAN